MACTGFSFGVVNQMMAKIIMIKTVCNFTFYKISDDMMTHFILRNGLFEVEVSPYGKKNNT